jgi:hypothetical protein
MNETTVNSFGLEGNSGFSHPLISWRSVVAGLIVAVFIDAALMALSVGIGGNSMIGGIQSDVSTASWIAGAWVVGAALIGLLFGGYFAARVSKFSTPVIGAAQGLVMTSLFFAFALWQAGNLIGATGQMAGRTVSGAASVAGYGINSLSENVNVQNIVNDSLSDLNLKSSPDVVASGVISRLMQGDTTSAKTYLARQAGITTLEADQRINALNQRFTALVAKVRDTMGQALSAAGWSLFILMVLGAGFASAGGALGARFNLRRPMVVERREYAAGNVQAARV